MTDIKDHYDRMVEQVYQLADGTSGSHIAGISAVALADAMIDTWIFKAAAERSSIPGEKAPLEIDPEFVGAGCAYGTEHPSGTDGSRCGGCK